MTVRVKSVVVLRLIEKIMVAIDSPGQYLAEASDPDVCNVYLIPYNCPLTLLLVGFLEYVNWWGGGDSAPPSDLENY